MILLTRPRETSEATAAKLPGIPCIIEPMLEIKKLGVEIKNAGQVFIATSKNGASFAPASAKLISIPEQGKNSAEILEYVLKNIPTGSKIIYLRGNEITTDITKKLRADGYDAEDIIAYEVNYAENFSQNFLGNLHNIKIAIFFSTNTAITFHELAKKHDLLGRLSDIIFLGVSEKVSTIARGHYWKKIVHSDAPDENSLLEKLKTIYSAL